MLNINLVFSLSFRYKKKAEKRLFWGRGCAIQPQNPYSEFLFLVKSHEHVWNLIKNRAPLQVCSYEFYDIFQKNFFIKHLWWQLRLMISCNTKIFRTCFYFHYYEYHCTKNEEFHCTKNEELPLMAMREKCPNTELFLVRIFLYSVQIQENTDQKQLRIWTVFMQYGFFSKCDQIHRKLRIWSHLLKKSITTSSLTTKHFMRFLLIFKNFIYFLRRGTLSLFNALLQCSTQLFPYTGEFYFCMLYLFHYI